MLGREELISVEKAREILFQYAPFVLPLETELHVHESCGRTLCRDIISPEDLPAFRRSTVDGFAVRSPDTFGATEGIPCYLVCDTEILMGEAPGFILGKGHAAKIATGGMLPEDADAVVMLEHTQQIDRQTMEIVKPVSPGENVIQAGEDVRRGEPILRKGMRIRPQDMGALAGLGITEIPVFEKPAVSIISTGDEVVPPDTPLKPGQVRDINSFTLSGLILREGGVPLHKGICRDDYRIIRTAVEQSMKDSRMILISGGSSVGTKDLTEKVINDCGSPGVLFHGVALKPGKPLIGAVMNGIPAFGLPGHPAAVGTCFELFIRPALHILSGLDEKRFQMDKKIIWARMARNVSSSPGREEHIGVTVEERDGELWAIPVLGKSGLITNLTKADGTAVIPLRKLGLQEGDIVKVRLF